MNLVNGVSKLDKKKREKKDTKRQIGSRKGKIDHDDLGDLRIMLH